MSRSSDCLFADVVVVVNVAGVADVVANVVVVAVAVVVCSVSLSRMASHDDAMTNALQQCVCVVFPVRVQMRVCVCVCVLR